MLEKEEEKRERVVSVEIILLTIFDIHKRFYIIVFGLCLFWMIELQTIKFSMDIFIENKFLHDLQMLWQLLLFYFDYVNGYKFIVQIMIIQKGCEYIKF